MRGPNRAVLLETRITAKLTPALSSSERRSAEFWCFNLSSARSPKLDADEINARKPLSDKIPPAEDVANFLRIHPSTIYRLAKRGDLPAFRVELGAIGASVPRHLSNGWNHASKRAEAR